MADIDRFLGVDGARRVFEAFYSSEIALGSRDVAEKLTAVSEIVSFDPGDELITQGDSDSDLFHILFGAVVIERFGRAGPVRRAGSHVGEMALIDLRQRRAATVRALEGTVVAKINERDFRGVASEYPDLWRNLAREVANRLRQRLGDVPPKNARPFVFVGSSSEGKAIAEDLVNRIGTGTIDVRLWSQGVFEASETAIESLEKMVRESDFAVLVLSPDDAVRSRGNLAAAPRDNVIFELGLFMGALGRSRVFALCEASGAPTRFQRLFRRQQALKIPTDLLGVTTLRYQRVPGKAPDLEAVAKELLRRFDEGPK